MDLKIWPLLNLRSKRAWLKTRKKWGHINTYTPRMALVQRLMSQLGMSEQAVRDQISKERQWILDHRKYYE